MGGTAWAVWYCEDKWESGEDLHKAAFPSEVANRVYEDAKLFLSKGLSRSILLYGPPGVGKSHVLRRVRDLVGGYSLRFEARAVSTYPADCQNLARILRPDVVLIDDVDRTPEKTGHKGQATLTFLESIRDDVKLVLASANFLNEMDPAALRAGRWDQLVEITSLDEGVLEALIGDEVPTEFRERLRKLPVAYIHEFHRRREVLGLALALDSVENLVAQAEMVASLCAQRARSQ
jgi:SpoVK/Ycf46/Vps4 family AAA+-type ATPase